MTHRSLPHQQSIHERNGGDTLQMESGDREAGVSIDQHRHDA
jgi:hypothetical protein